MPSPESPANRMTTSSRLSGSSDLVSGVAVTRPSPRCVGSCAGGIQRNALVPSIIPTLRSGFLDGSAAGPPPVVTTSSERFQCLERPAGARRRRGAGHGPGRRTRPRRRRGSRRPRDAGRSAGATGPTTTTASPGSRVSIHAGGSQTVTGTEVARSSAVGPAGQRTARVARRVPDSRTRTSGDGRAGPAEHAQVDLEIGGGVAGARWHGFPSGSDPGAGSRAGGSWTSDPGYDRGVTAIRGLRAAP